MLQLPSLQQRATLTSSPPSGDLAVPCRMWFSPDNALLAVQWM